MDATTAEAIRRVMTKEVLDVLQPEHHGQLGLTPCNDDDRQNLVWADGFPACSRCAYLNILDGKDAPKARLLPALYFRVDKYRP